MDRLDGVIDRVSIVTQDGDEQAFLSARLPRDRFAEALAALEDSGRVVRKELQEGGGLPPGAEPVQPQEPDARIEFSLIEKGAGSDAGLIAAIVAPIVGCSRWGSSWLCLWVGGGAPRRTRSVACRQ